MFNKYYSKEQIRKIKTAQVSGKLAQTPLQKNRFFGQTFDHNQNIDWDRNKRINFIGEA